MPITRFIIISVLLLTCLSPGGVSALPEPLAGAAKARRSIADVLALLPVVEAVVTRVEPRPEDSTKNGRSATVTLEVTKVYCGAGIRPRDTVSVVAIDGFPPMASQTRTLQLPAPIPKTGDAGVWLVHVAGDGKGLRGNWDSGDRSNWEPLEVAVGFRLPFLGHEGPHPEGAAASSAKTAEALAFVGGGRDDAERLSRLAAAGRSNDPYVSFTACWVLHQATGTSGRGKVARELFRDPSVCIPARLALDEMLCRWPEPGWSAGEVRREAIIQMARAAKEQADFDALGQRLFYAADAGQFTMADCIAIWAAVLGNDRAVPVYGDQLWQLASFARAPHSAHERDVAFDYFRTQLASDAAIEIRRAAALAIADVGLQDFPLSTSEIRVVRRLRASATDAEITRLLDLALERAAKHPPQTQPTQ